MHIEIEADAGPRGILAVDGSAPRAFDGWLALLVALGDLFPDDLFPNDTGIEAVDTRDDAVGPGR